MVDDGTAKFTVKIVCAKEYVDACVQSIDKNFSKKIQYGTIKAKTVIAGGGQYETILVPVEFPDENYVVQLTLARPFAYYGDSTLTAYKKTATSFSMQIWINTKVDLSSENILIQWLAIHK